jgi:predicted nucleic acid-binding protein
MRYLLDTNVLSELRKFNLHRADPHVSQWVRSVSSAELYTSVIVIQELEIGMLRSERNDPPKGAMLRDWIYGNVLPAFSDRILPVDLTVAMRCAKLHVPNSRAYSDALIAATGIVHSMTVVTRNTADFEGTGAVLLNPWQFQL